MKILPVALSILVITSSNGFVIRKNDPCFFMSKDERITRGRKNDAVYPMRQQIHSKVKKLGVTSSPYQLDEEAMPVRGPPVNGKKKEQKNGSSIGGVGRTREEILVEIGSGKELGNNDDVNTVIDFAGVQNTESRAELALKAAREEYVASLGLKKTHESNSGSHGHGRLMGINDEVVAEVGREIGEFITQSNDKGRTLSPEEVDDRIQACASYLRSKAATGDFFQVDDVPSSSSSSSSSSSFSKDEELEFESVLKESYEECGVVTSAFAKTFYLGTQLLPPSSRKAIWAIYVWCRRTDEIVDAPRSENDRSMLSDLSEWEIRLERLWSHGEVVDALDLPLLDVRVTYPNLDIGPFVDMIRGMLMDIPQLGQERYETFEELHLYCYRVAGTVGLMSMPVFGCADGITEDHAREPALSLGVAFQLTNILRDVGEDATTRGRIYLPRSDMAKFNVTESQLYDQRVDSNYINLMKFQIARARQYYKKAKTGVKMLRPESRLPVQTSLDSYGRILDKIEENGYDSLTRRAYVGKMEKFFTIPLSWYRTLDISDHFPLPGDHN